MSKIISKKISFENEMFNRLLNTFHTGGNIYFTGSSGGKYEVYNVYIVNGDDHISFTIDIKTTPKIYVTIHPNYKRICKTYKYNEVLKKEEFHEYMKELSGFDICVSWTKMGIILLNKKEREMSEFLLQKAKSNYVICEPSSEYNNVTYFSDITYEICNFIIESFNKVFETNVKLSDNTYQRDYVLYYPKLEDELRQKGKTRWKRSVCPYGFEFSSFRAYKDNPSWNKFINSSSKGKTVNDNDNISLNSLFLIFNEIKRRFDLAYKHIFNKGLEVSFNAVLTWLKENGNFRIADIYIKPLEEYYFNNYGLVESEEKIIKPKPNFKEKHRIKTINNPRQRSKKILREEYEEYQNDSFFYNEILKI